MNLATISFFILLTIFATAEICDHVFKIYSNKFYNSFHFLGGLFTYVLIVKLTGQPLLSIVFTFIVGVLWEIHEWILWYTLLKKDKHHKPDDSLVDLFFDLFGAVSALVILGLFKI